MLDGGSVFPLTNPLQDLKKFLDESKKGVVVLSLGTHVKSENLDAAVVKSFTEAFAGISQDVLWKWDADKPPENLPKNVKIVKVLPQNDVLGEFPSCPSSFAQTPWRSPILEVSRFSVSFRSSEREGFREPRRTAEYARGRVPRSPRGGHPDLRRPVQQRAEGGPQRRRREAGLCVHHQGLSPVGPQQSPLRQKVKANQSPHEPFHRSLLINLPYLLLSWTWSTLCKSFSLILNRFTTKPPGDFTLPDFTNHPPLTQRPLK